MSTYLDSGSATPVCTALITICKKTVNCLFGTCVTLVYIQFFFLVPVSCPRHSTLLYGIGTNCVQCIELDYLDQHNGPHQEFDLGRSQNL